MFHMLMSSIFYVAIINILLILVLDKYVVHLLALTQILETTIFIALQQFSLLCLTSSILEP